MFTCMRTCGYGNGSSFLSWLSPFILAPGSHVHRWMGTRVCMCLKYHDWFKISSSITLCLTLWGKGSQSDPELANMTSLPRQLAPGFGLHFPRLELEVGHHTHLAFMWVLVILSVVLLLAWQVLYPLSQQSPHPQATKLIFKVSKTSKHWQWNDLGYCLDGPGSVLCFQIQFAKWSVHSLWGSLSDGHLTVTLVPTFQK